MPTALETAYATAQQHGISPEEFRQRISDCFARGYVFSTPSEFVAAEPCEHNGQPAYFVYMAAGGSGNALGRFLRYAPEPRPYIIWQRRNDGRPRVFTWDKLMKKAGGN